MEIIGKGPQIIGAKNNIAEKDMISRDAYKRIKNYNRVELSGYVKNLYRKGFEAGMKIGEQEAERKAEARKKQAAAAIAPERTTYQPFCCWGRVHDTGTPLDGHLYLVSLWDWDKYEDFHLVSFGEHDDEAGEAMMKAMHDADDAYKDTPIEEFKELWDKGEYEAPGVYTIQLEKVEIVRIVTMEGYIAAGKPDEATEEPAEATAEEGGNA